VTPLEYSVVFSEISLCTACFTTIGYPTGDSARVSWNAGDVLNTSHTLTQTSGCVWEKTLTNAIFEEVFFDAACGTADVNGINDVYIKLTRSLTDWTLEVSTEFNAWLFYDVQAGLTSGGNQICASLPSFSTDLVTCGAVRTLGPDVATGGTATVTCL